MKQELHSDQGIPCYINGLFSLMWEGETLNHPWTSILHTTPSDKLPTNKENWKKSIENCKGLFVFSEHTKKYLAQIIPNTLIEVLRLPSPVPYTKFNPKLFNNKLIMVGHWKRNWSKFNEAETNLKKIIIKTSNHKFQFNIEIIDRLNDDDYDILMSKSAVFLYLDDASANNAVVESLARKTPLFVNRHPAVCEYLGADYPLFYDDPKDIKNMNWIDGYNYLESIKEHTQDSFIDSIKESEIWKNIHENNTCA